MKAMANLFNRYRAARNIARLYSGDMSAEEERKIRTWPKANEDYRQDFLETNHMIADLKGLAGDPDILGVAEQTGPLGWAERAHNNWPRLSVAAGLLLAVVLGVATLVETDVQTVGNVALRYVTQVGEQKAVNLDDGTVVTMNTGTEMLVSPRDNSRLITLQRGEAFFDVAKDPRRPFSIDLGPRTVTVLGTAFNVLKSPEKLTVTVIEGEVAIHKPGQQVFDTAPLLKAPQGKSVTIASPEQNRLAAGWVAEFDVASNELSAYAPENISRLSSWRTGQIRFKNETLREVVRELNRYTGKKILIEDTGIMDLKVYAAVRLDRIDLALSSFEKTLPVKVVRHFDRTVLKSREK